MKAVCIYSETYHNYNYAMLFVKHANINQVNRNIYLTDVLESTIVYTGVHTVGG